MSSGGSSSLGSKLFGALSTLMLMSIVIAVVSEVIAAVWLQVVIVCLAFVVVLTVVWAMAAWWTRRYW